MTARLAADLRTEFPQIKGFSPSTLQSMRGFAAAWNVEGSISPHPVGKLCFLSPNENSQSQTRVSISRLRLAGSCSQSSKFQFSTT